MNSHLTQHGGVVRADQLVEPDQRRVGRSRRGCSRGFPSGHLVGVEKPGPIIAPVMPVDLGQLPTPPPRGTARTVSVLPTPCGVAWARPADGLAVPPGWHTTVRERWPHRRSDPVARAPVLPRLLHDCPRRMNRSPMEIEAALARPGCQGHRPAAGRRAGSASSKGDASNRSYYRVGTGRRQLGGDGDAAGRHAEERGGHQGRAAEGAALRERAPLPGRPGRARAAHPPLRRARGDDGARGPRRRHASRRRSLGGTTARRSTPRGGPAGPAARRRPRRSPTRTASPSRRAFDEDLYDWELHHFREWGLEVVEWQEAHRRPSAPSWTASFRDIARQLAAAPRGFTHRDYQSRNLMVKDGELVVIDFQDALQGPRAVRPGGAAARQLRGARPRTSWTRCCDRYLATLRAGDAASARARGLPSLLRPAHRAAQAEGRGPLRVHRPGEGQPRASWSPSPQSLRYVREALRAARRRRARPDAAAHRACRATCPETGRLKAMVLCAGLGTRLRPLTDALAQAGRAAPRSAAASATRWRCCAAPA